MPLKLLRKYFVVLLVLFFQAKISLGQACTNLGQTPSTAFPVCGTIIFHQASVPICATVNIFVPGCSTQPGGAAYQNKNPYFYKFTCYASGTLGFLITPLAPNEDYDWQLWDITGQNPDAIFTNTTLVVTGNWAGTYGPTGASATGVNSIQCASDPAANLPTFAAMPNLVVGHEYILMVSHFTNGQSGYDLSFGGGTAVITDPNIPHLGTAKPDCDGTKITVKLNKKVKCTSITANGSEFSLLPAVTTVTAALPDSCGFGFDFDEITLTLTAPLTNGNYNLVINNGSDGNTLRDYCDNVIPVGDNIPFTYMKPQPIFADSVGKPGCAPDSIRVYFPKKIDCGTIAANGSDFSVSGPSPVNVIGAFGHCTNNKTDYIIVKFSSPISIKGTYTVSLKAGSDGNVVIDECGQETPLQTLSFVTVDTVSADFQNNILYGCLKDTLFFSHNGAHDVNYWKWNINSFPAVFTPTTSIIASASSSNNVKLFVSNGVCTDSTSVVIKLDNEVKASFEMEDIICPEDEMSVKNTSTGSIDTWRWTYGSIGTSLLKDPQPFLFPTLSREIKYRVKLVVTNQALGCSDSVIKILTVLDFCIIDVPNAFTPNNDGLNDKFGPHNALKADNYEFKVFNRWGQLVFRSTNWRDRWDGTIKGIPQQPGVFVWMLSYIHRDTKQQVFKKGTVTLIR
ncbi:MAG TPA: gliding motility-associated C-terminal domain-containing protein [Chitinophagaceae bacterium]|nr:gliding motility-associated C-terminal domain-containing protein [Chitinophagaceae bacterium]